MSSEACSQLRTGRSLRDRLRLATFALTVLILTVVVMLQLRGVGLFPYLFGDDFLPSYMAGTFVREGQTDLLMDFDAARAFQTKTRQVEGLEQHGRVGPWLNPPYFAAVFAPLSALPYRTALWTWFSFNLLMSAGSIVLLYRMLPASKRTPGDGIVLGLLLILSMPFLQAMASQQNTFLSLFVLCAAITFARANHAFPAGAVAALLLFKPQLAVIVCGAMVCLLGYRALLGMATTSAALLLATLILMPGTVGDYLTQLPNVLPSLRIDQPYAWERQTTFVGFWRLLLGGRTGGPNSPTITLLWLMGAASLALLLVPPLWRALRRGVDGATRDRLLAAVIASSPLLMPYYMDYDLLLLAVSMVLLAGERLHTGSAPGDRPLIAVWVSIYTCLYFNAGIAEATGISVVVLLLAVRSALPPRTIAGAAASGDLWLNTPFVPNAVGSPSLQCQGQSKVGVL